MAGSFLPIIYVEANPADAQAFQSAFHQARLPNDVLLFRNFDDITQFFQRVIQTHEPAPALVLINVELEKQCGFEVIQWIREQTGLVTVPIIAVSNEYKFSHLERCYDIGANLFVLKPRTIQEWTDLVFRLQGYWSTQYVETVPQIM